MKSTMWCLSAVFAALSFAEPTSTLRAAEWDPGSGSASRLYPDEDLRVTGPADQEIRNELRRAGLTPDRIRVLQRDHFEYGRVQESVEDALAARGVEQEQARRWASELAEHIDRLKPRQQAGQYSNERPVDQSEPAQDWRRVQLRQKLQQAGLHEPEIRHLEQRGFRPPEMEQAVRDSLMERGYDRSSARQQANTLGTELRGYFPRAERRDVQWQEDDRRAASPRQLREDLARLGLSERQIDRLQRRDFPPEDVRVLVQDRLEDQGYSPEWAHRRAREAAAEAYRWRQNGRW